MLGVGSRGDSSAEPGVAKTVFLVFVEGSGLGFGLPSTEASTVTGVKLTPEKARRVGVRITARSTKP